MTYSSHLSKMNFARYRFHAVLAARFLGVQRGLRHLGHVDALRGERFVLPIRTNLGRVVSE